MRERVVGLRLELAGSGLDAGPVTIAWHLAKEGCRVPSTSTIRRILHGAGLVVSEPRKRPGLPTVVSKPPSPISAGNLTPRHWRLADGADVEILNWLDDHSGFLVGCTVHAPVTGDVVVEQFLTACVAHGTPAATLTDNGRIYTARFGGGKNAFEYLLAFLGITQKNGHPGHPQTQGKVERFHQTQKRWLTGQPPAKTITELQHQLDCYQEIYNTRRPHRSLDRQAPATAYAALPKAKPAAGNTAIEYHRLRYDRVDAWGKTSFRRAGRMHHLGVGCAHRGVKVLAIADEVAVTIVELETSQIQSTHAIDPDKHYWRNTQKAPGRWPRAF